MSHKHQNRSIRIAIADDHAIFRDGLRKLLQAEPGFCVVGEAVNGAEAIEVARQLKPDILLLEIAIPRHDGLTVLRELEILSTPTRTLLLVATIGNGQLIEALELGARGVVLKGSATHLLFKGIRTVMTGQYWLGRESVSDVVRALRARQKTMALTPRELQIVAAVVDGCANKDIAQKFRLSEATVKHHLTSVFYKLGVSNRSKLAVFAIENHLVGEEPTRQPPRIALTQSVFEPGRRADVSLGARS